MSADIRLARMTDVDELVGIENAVFGGDRISRRSFRHLAAVASAAVLVAEVDRRIAGYAVLLFRNGNRTARLYSLAAAPGEAGRGHGHALMAAAEAEARRRHASVLRLEVRADNDRARRLYEARGYRETGSVADYYADGATARRFEKPLAAPEARETQDRARRFPT